MAERKPSPSTVQFQTHQVHIVVKQWTERLPTERPSGYGELPPEPRDAYVRLRWAVRELRIRLTRLHPMLASKRILDALNQCFANLEAPWNQYRSNPKVLWQQLNNQTDALTGQMLSLPSTDGVAASAEMVKELAADMNNAIDVANEKVTSLQANADAASKRFLETQSKLQGLESEIQAQKARLDQMLTQHSEAFSKVEQDRVAQFTKVENERLAKFNEAQEQRKAKFDTALTEFQTAKKETIEKYRAELASNSETVKGKAQELLDKLQKELDRAVEIVGIVVKTSMSGNYQIIANREYWNAWIMRGVAIASFLAMGGMVISVVHSMALGPSGIDWRTFAFRLSLGSAFVIPGIYCATESSRHWNQEKHNRGIALEMAALTPFIGQLDPAKQREIIEKKADEYFGRKSPHRDGDEPASLKDLHLSGSQMSAILQEIVKILKAK